MKLKKFEVINHPIIGTLALDFCFSDGAVADTIVIAGDNGCGKTTILDAIYALGIEGEIPTEQDEIRKYTIKLLPTEISYIHRWLGQSEGKSKLSDELTIEIAKAKHGSGICKVFCTLNGVPFEDLRGYNEENFNKVRKAAYSSAEISFQSATIKAITGSELDSATRYRAKTSTNLATEIHQLLIDVYMRDSAAVMKWVKDNAGKAPPTEIIEERTNRFRKAFSIIAPHISLEGMSDKQGRVEFKFLSFSKDVSINDLSSGEKQIIFRGGHLLRDKKYMDGIVVCLDEPEISLHPNWQAKILEFYKTLLKDDKNHQTSQLFVATHSPQIIHSTVDEKVLILTRGTTGQVQINSKSEYPGASKETLVQEAFNYPKAFAGIKNKHVVLVEGPTDEEILNYAWHALYPSRSMPFQIVNSLSADHIRSILSRDDTYTNYKDYRFVGVLDFDGAYDAWNGLHKATWTEVESDKAKGLTKKRNNENGFAVLLPVPVFRNNYADKSFGGSSLLSIEFLFPDNLLTGYVTSQPLPQGMTRDTFNSGMKTRFAAQTAGFKQGDFACFIPLFEKIETCLGLSKGSE